MPVGKQKNCNRCRRPLRDNQGYKRVEGRFTVYYCDEHVVLTATGWRLLAPGEDPPPAVGSPEALAANVAESRLEADSGPPEIPMKTWADVAPDVLEAPVSGPTTTPAAAAAPVVKRLQELQQQPVDPLSSDDLGF